MRTSHFHTLCRTIVASVAFAALMASTLIVGSARAQAGCLARIASGSPASNGLASVAGGIHDCNVWHIIPSPNSPQLPNSRLLGVSALSDDSTWAVGLTFLEDDVARTLIERWDHGAWQVISSPNPTGTFQSVLDSAAVISSQDAWAVGSNLYIVSGMKRTNTLIEHWNGTQWSLVASPNPSSIYNSLASVAAISASNVWAVGDYTDAAGTGLPLAERWDDSAWHVVPTAPLPAATEGMLATVAAIPGTTHLWAVGNSVKLPRPSPQQGLIEYWDGTQWQLIPNGAPSSAQSSELLGVTALSATNAWAVGDYTPSGSDLRKPLIEHWNGSVWQSVPSPLPAFADRGPLLSVAASATGNVQLVGSFFAPDAGTGQPWFERWDGRQWRLVPSPIPAGAVFTEVNALTANSAGIFWAVGDYFTSTSPLFRTLTERNLPCPSRGAAANG